MSGLSSCPNCHQPIMPADDICEHCGAVISTLTIAPVHSVPLAPPSAVALSTPASNLRECPHCHGPRSPTAKFCGRCGYSYVETAKPVPPATMSHTVTTLPDTLLPVQERSIQIGRLLSSRYRIIREIGSGGMGAVFLADDRVLRREVVVKALLRDVDPELISQIIKEHEFLTTLQHTNIVSIYDFIIIGGQGYIVMEYVRGKTLEQLMEERGGPLEVEEAIRSILQVLPAFDYLAKLNLVYCDFKPHNVMVDVCKDGTQVVKLIDLGTVIRHAAHDGQVYGTHGFYAPEAVKLPSPETDLYSICRTLAYLITHMELADPIFGMPPAENYKLFRDYPTLYRLLVRGTHSDPARRFHSAEELSDQLTGVLRQIIGGKPGVPISSRLFAPAIVTVPGESRWRYETVLDENDTVIALLRYGDQIRWSGNYASALSFYNQAARVNPQSIDTHLRLAEVYIEQGAFTLAQDEVAQVQCRAISNWKLNWYRGRLLEGQQKFAEAAAEYRELMADLPGELPPQQALARVYACMKDDRAAAGLYMKVLKADPDNAEAVIGAAHALFRLQRWNDAARILKEVSGGAAAYLDAQLLLVELYLCHMQPLMPVHIQKAAEVVESLYQHTEEPRYYLARGDVYRAAWQMARKRRLPADSALAGVSDTKPRTLGAIAEESYRLYLELEQCPTNREEIVRRKFAVTPWHFLRLWNIQRKS